MLPLAPVLFSTTTCWPQIWDSWAATIRAVASTPPHAAIGQMMRATCVGHVCAHAANGHAAVAPVTILMKSRRLMQRSPEERQDRRPPRDIIPDPALPDVGQGNAGSRSNPERFASQARAGR